MEWVDSNPIPWTPYGSASPCGFLVDSMEYPINLHCKSMYCSMWIPWNSPYGIHMEESISNFVEEPSIVVSKIVSPSRIELSAPQHIKCASKAALLQLSHASVRR